MHLEPRGAPAGPGGESWDWPACPMGSVPPASGTSRPRGATVNSLASFPQGQGAGSFARDQQPVPGSGVRRGTWLAFLPLRLLPRGCITCHLGRCDSLGFICFEGVVSPPATIYASQGETVPFLVFVAICRRLAALGACPGCAGSAGSEWGLRGAGKAGISAPRARCLWPPGGADLTLTLTPA